LTGGFDLLRGSLSLVGKRLIFTRGRVRFDGEVTPELDLVAETSAGGVTARISVTGPAAHSSFAVTSTPALPADEILSRVPFQQPSGSLSPFQALELANSVATLSGRGDAFERLRRSLASTASTSARARAGTEAPCSAFAARSMTDQRGRDDRSEAERQRRSRRSRRHPGASACRLASTQVEDRAPVWEPNGSTNSHRPKFSGRPARPRPARAASLYDPDQLSQQLAAHGFTH
jgi:hypothetical protein